MTYLTAWTIIIAAVLATLALGYIINRFAIRRVRAVAPATIHHHHHRH